MWAGFSATASGDIVETIENLPDLRHRAAGQQHPDRAIPGPPRRRDRRRQRQPGRSRFGNQRAVRGSGTRYSDSWPAPETGPLEQIERLANVTQVLADNSMVVKNVLHAAPNALVNGYNIYNPDTGGPRGSFAMNNFSNPVATICSAISAVENVTAEESGGRAPSTWARHCD